MERRKGETGGFLKFSHRIIWGLLKSVSFIYTRLFLGFRCKDRYKIKRGESVIVLSNHQTDTDMLCIFQSFSKPLYPVATDNIFTGGGGKILSYLGVIPKKKGAADIRSAINITAYLKNGLSILLFPEGNRYYAEFQYYISPKITQFIKKTRATIVLFNMRGGSGVSPRFAKRRRRGKFSGEIKRILPYEEYSEMDNGELFRVIKEGLRVYDSDGGESYKSRCRAEYLEKMFFVCPECKGVQTLVSEKNAISCEKCGLSVEYGEDLHLKSKDENFRFTRLIDWWDMQKRFVNDMAIEGGSPVFADACAKLFSTERGGKKTLIAKGPLAVYSDRLTLNGYVIKTDTIETATVVSGGKLVFSAGGKNFTITGGKRFNPLKYVLLFRRLGLVSERESGNTHISEDNNA